jgi:hypothetical protein
MPNIDDELRAKTAAFATDLADLVRRAALESVSAALGSTTVTAPAPIEVAVKRGRGRPRKVIPTKPLPAAPAIKTTAPMKAYRAAPALKAAAPKKPAAPARPFGAKRPPGELAKLTEKLAEYIKAHPGLRMEAIGKALGAPTKDLSFPIKKLILAKKIRSEGHKRATEYFAA